MRPEVDLLLVLRREVTHCLLNFEELRPRDSVGSRHDSDSAQDQLSYMLMLVLEVLRFENCMLRQTPVRHR